MKTMHNPDWINRFAAQCRIFADTVAEFPPEERDNYGWEGSVHFERLVDLFIEADAGEPAALKVPAEESGEPMDSRIFREIELFTHKEKMCLTLGESGVDIWIERQDWPYRFPLSAMMDWDWAVFTGAVISIQNEARRRAKMEVAFQQLVDPIDGPDGEA